MMRQTPRYRLDAPPPNLPLAQRNEQIMMRQPRTRELMDRLLELGGTEVCLPWEGEPDLEIILERGSCSNGPVLFIELDPRQCHRNASQIWLQNPRLTRIATGYAMNDDNLWRPHTWIWSRSGNPLLVETTEERLLYYGAILTNAECQIFAQSNTPLPRTFDML